MKINKNMKINNIMKINKNIIIIIILVVLLIILGIYWYYKHNKIIEGQQDQVEPGGPPSTEAAQSLTDNIVGAFEESGIDITNIGPAMDAMKNLKNMLKKSEADLVDPENIYAEEGDTSGNLINTTPDTYPGKTFLAGNDRISDSFCEINKFKPDLNEQCNKLTADHCNQTSCCVFLNGKQCVAGSESGPHITTDPVSGFDIDYTYYSYKNNCYGTCDGMGKAANPCSRYKDDSTGISKECIKRYWSQTNCPNQEFITDTLVSELKDNSRLSIKEKIKQYATKEQDFDKCYGIDESKWPEPCTGTTSTSFGLSKRCLTHLFKDAGCPFEGTIDQSFIDEHALEPKSVMINKFTGYFNGKDTASRQKCYGYDQMAWPDPCEGIPDTTIISDVSRECLQKTANDLFKGQCNIGYSETLDQLFDKDGKWIGKKSKADNTLQKFKQMPQEDIDKIMFEKLYRGPCYGSNPNNWPNITKVSPDPCEGIKSVKFDNNKKESTRLDKISFGCRQRLSELTSNIDVKNNLKSRKPRGELGSVLYNVD